MEGRARPAQTGLPTIMGWESGNSVALPAFDTGSHEGDMADHKSIGPGEVAHLVTSA